MADHRTIAAAQRTASRRPTAAELMKARAEGEQLVRDLCATAGKHGVPILEALDLARQHGAQSATRLIAEHGEHAAMAGLADSYWSEAH